MNSWRALTRIAFRKESASWYISSEFEESAESSEEIGVVFEFAVKAFESSCEVCSGDFIGVLCVSPARSSRESGRMGMAKSPIVIFVEASNWTLILSQDTK